MDKPTSEKDVIKSLPPEKERRIHGMTPDEYRERNRLIGDSIPLFKIKPVFDKMLAALKAQDNLIDQVHQRSENDRGVPKEEQKRILWLNAWLLFSNSVQDLEQAIKEAEELGL